MSVTPILAGGCTVRKYAIFMIWAEPPPEIAQSSASTLTEAVQDINVDQREL